MLFVSLICLVAMFFVFKFGLAENKPAELISLDSEELDAMLSKNDEIYLIDLRESELYFKAHIQNAINIPFDQFGLKYKKVPKDKKIILVCHTGRMGTESGQLLLKNGYKEVYNLNGGMAMWNVYKSSINLGN
jgi:rhodanese-related sulfurtransferase